MATGPVGVPFGVGLLREGRLDHAEVAHAMPPAGLSHQMREGEKHLLCSFITRALSFFVSGFGGQFNPGGGRA